MKEFTREYVVDNHSLVLVNTFQECSKYQGLFKRSKGEIRWTKKIRDLEQEVKGKHIPESCRKQYWILTILDFDTVEFARQMTLVDHRFIRRLGVDELLCRRFENPVDSPIISSISECVNKMTIWMATQVCFSPNEIGSSIVAKFIEISEVLMKYKNWNGFMTIMVGLSQTKIVSKTEVWQLLPTSVREKFYKLQTYIFPSFNFGALRPLHDQLPGDKYPSVKTPIVFLKDLVMLNEGSKDWIDKEKGIINASKMSVLGRLVQTIHTPRMKYNFRKVRIIQDFIVNLPVECDEKRDNASAMI
eukprot:TRINITY_DN3957_c0_g1_i3.p1 TRINITY_DN3957_c0_g1~~TRINITY_DN3957_c0_g1_i3.p1  ORF type:complete len:302 (-),score=49.22 TRINITY_DN3957_c0_g1_i3:417-1322(-)